jgi:hypothetical protein
MTTERYNSRFSYCFAKYRACDEAAYCALCKNIEFEVSGGLKAAETHEADKCATN